MTAAMDEWLHFAATYNDQKESEMNEIETIEAELKAADESVRALERQKDKALAEARRLINEAHHGPIREASQAADLVRQRLREAKSAAAAHPWEGKKVYREEWSGSTWNQRKTKIYGIVEVCRTDTVFPDNIASCSRPAIGAAFVRLLKKDGTPGMKIHRYGVNQWKLADD